MLKKDLKLERNYLLIEYAFVDKGINVMSKGETPQGQEPVIAHRKIISKGKDVSNTLVIDESVILNPNTVNYESIPVFFDDNTYDRKLVATQVVKDITKYKNDKQLNTTLKDPSFEKYLVLAYAILPESCVVASYLEKKLDMNNYYNTKSIITTAN